MLKHPRGGVSQKEMRAIMAKLKQHKHVGFPNMKVYLMNKINPNTDRYFTEEEATNVAGQIYQNQQHKKEEIKKEKK